MIFSGQADSLVLHSLSSLRKRIAKTVVTSLAVLSVPRDSNLSWITGDQIFLARVVSAIEKMNDKFKYEYYGGENHLGRIMETCEFSKFKPLIYWNNNMGCVTMPYDVPF
jgi:hypothetical protein